jgi:putative PEP-CTERM system histidine kinase
VIPGIASSGYVVAAIAYGVLVLVLLTGWRQRMRGSLVALACMLSVVWAATLAMQAAGKATSGLLILGAECARTGAWLIVIARVLGSGSGRARLSWIPWSVAAAVLATWLTGAAMELTGAGSQASAPLERLTVYFGLAASALGLVLVEQVYRNTREDQAWALRLLWVGAGGLFAYDLLLFSTAVMMGSIPEPAWAARGVIGVLMAGLLAVGFRRIRRWRPRQFMSLQLACYVTAFGAAGVYLVAMSLAGWYLRIIGGHWGAAIQITFMFGAIVMLAVILPSRQVQARLRVLLAKHFFPYKYDYRHEWQRLVQTVSATSNDDSLYDRVLRALQQLMHAAVAGLWVRDESGRFLPVAGELVSGDSPAVGAEDPLLGFIAAKEWIGVIGPGGETTGEAAALVGSADWLRAVPRAWLLVPLLNESSLVAFVVLARPMVPGRIGWEELDLLKTAGRQLASYVVLDQSAQRLAEAGQFEAFNRLTAFLMHDLKNMAAQLRLVVQNSERFAGDANFQRDAMLSVKETSARMEGVIGQLAMRDSSGQGRLTTLATALANVVERCSDRRPRPVIHAVDKTLLVQADPVAFMSSVESLVRNAQDASPADGSVTVTVRSDQQAVVICIEDTGCGMSADFIQRRLFQPFFSTKGSKGMGIGAYQARAFARAAGGDLTVVSRPGHGSTFQMRLPVSPALAREERESERRAYA